MIESGDQSLGAIYNSFKEGNKIDLRSIKSYFDANKNLKDECKIFIKKLDVYLGSKRTPTMSKQQFFQYFNQSVSDPNHFNAVFDSIDVDGSGYISRNELRELFRKYNVAFGEQDIAMMIEACSQDGQKIKKRDLQQFLRN